jgi:hypothetical protein
VPPGSVGGGREGGKEGRREGEREMRACEGEENETGPTLNLPAKTSEKKGRGTEGDGD